MSSRKKHSLLIIDDEQTSIHELSDMLSPYYTVHTITDGMKEIGIVKKITPDVILLNMMMPQMDNYDILSSLKTTPETMDIPVILITNHPDIMFEEKGLSLGASDYISKPFSQMIVKQRIKNQLELIRSKNIQLENARILDERFKQTALMNTISKMFLTRTFSNTVFSDILKLIGQHMHVANVLLYKLDDDFHTFTCIAEWLNPKIPMTSRLNDKLTVPDAMIKIMQSSLDTEDGELYFSSLNPHYGYMLKPERDHYANYMIVPIYANQALCAGLVFTSEDNHYEWEPPYKNLGILLSSLFSSVFERDIMERQYSIVENSTNIVLYLSAGGKIEYINPAAKDITGYSRDEFLNTGLSVIFEETFTEKLITHYIPSVIGGESMLFESFIEKKDGEKLTVLVTIIQTGPESIGITINDLTKMRALENEAKKVYIDGLTNIYNKRYIIENLPHVIRLASRSEVPLSVMMIDIDNFKFFNDTYGHQAGDECLIAVAKSLFKCLKREDDFVARYGGEEFLVVLPFTDEEGARIMAQSLLQSVYDNLIPHEKNPASDYVTVSIGVVCGIPLFTQTGDDYIAFADNLLYQSKQNGKNQYTFGSFENI